MKVRKILLALSFFLVQTTSSAAGFDCSLASLNETEKTICNTPYLSGSDNVMNNLFTEALNHTLSYGSLWQTQVNWLKTRNSC